MNTEPAFWVSASPIGFYAKCLDESARMRFTRENWLLSSGEIMQPRHWQDPERFAKAQELKVVVRVEAA